MLRAEGMDPETIARLLHAERLALSARFKALTPAAMRARIATRTRATYGNPDGPGIDDLRAAGKSWEQITLGACRPGRFPPWE
jgi:hypothetical protein